MELEDAERFVLAAEHDYGQRCWRYRVLMQEEDGPDEEELREVRADVLAAQQVLMLAREERRLAARRAGERAALGRLPIGGSGHWLERGDEEGRS